MVNLGSPAFQAGFERDVIVADCFPIVGEFLQSGLIELRVPFTAPQRSDHGVQVRLSREPGYGRKRCVDDVHPGLAGHEQGGLAIAGGIVGMEVHRNPDFLLQCLYQLVGGERLEQPRHVLDGKDVCAHVFQFLGKRNVIPQGILVSLGIGNIAGVADGSLAYLAGLPDRLHGDRHPLGPVERVEDTEDVYAARGRFFNKPLNHVVGIVGVADGIGPAQQHLEQDVGHGFLQLVQALPRAFLEEAHGDIERGSAPHFEGKQPVSQD